VVDENASTDKPGFMKEKLVVTRMAADRKTGKLLGAQVVGPGDVAKQIAQWALAIQGGLCVEGLVNVDLPYAPPFSLPIDHFIATAHVMQNKLKGWFEGISAVAVKRKLDAGEMPFLLDVRGPDEYRGNAVRRGRNPYPPRCYTKAPRPAAPGQEPGDHLQLQDIPARLLGCNHLRRKGLGQCEAEGRRYHGLALSQRK